MEPRVNPFSDRDIDDLIDVIDRRDSERHPPNTDHTYVWVSLDRRIQARVVDESEGGIGLQVCEHELFEVGLQVRVELGTQKRLATIVHATEMEQGQFRLGLEWERSPIEPSGSS